VHRHVDYDHCSAGSHILGREKVFVLTDTCKGVLPEYCQGATIMTDAEPKQNGHREYKKHGDSYRQRLLKERGIDAIDGRTPAGKKAKAWGRYALEKKGGKSCRIDTREKIEAGTFSLWRALCLRSYIVADARKRGTPINKRYAKLPMINEQYDTAMNQWQRINDELQLDKNLDLARRLMG
jgi:hypothetical protein